MQNIAERTVTRSTVDGEITEHTKTSRYKVSSEEDYLKVYIRTMSCLHNVHGIAVPVLNELLMRVGYNNQIVLAPSIRQDIADSVGIKPNTLTRRLTDLCDAKLLIKEGTNVYTINTYVFGRGKWADILEHRKSLPLKIVFAPEGVEFIDE